MFTYHLDNYIVCTYHMYILNVNTVCTYHMYVSDLIQILHQG